MPKTVEELGEDLCNHCPLPPEMQGVHCYGGEPVMCEGRGCEEAYAAYLETPIPKMGTPVMTETQFHEKYCINCYWHKYHGCKIETVKITYCINSTVSEEDRKSMGVL